MNANNAHTAAQDRVRRAAVDLARASDTFRLLQQCERATGRPFITEERVDALRDTVRNFTGGASTFPDRVRR